MKVRVRPRAWAARFSRPSTLVLGAGRKDAPGIGGGDLIFSALKGFSDKRRVSVGLVFASPELTVHVVLFRITIDFSGGNRKFRWRLAVWSLQHCETG